MMTIAQALKEASDYLTEDNWHQGSYFSLHGEQLCMCAHGAVQRAVNPVCKEAADGGRAAYTVQVVAAAERAARLGGRLGAAGAALAGSARRARAADSAGTTEEVFAHRPFWVKDDNGGYGCLDAHYIMGMVGLTAAYNDATGRTLAEVKSKFSEAIALAEKLGV